MISHDLSVIRSLCEYVIVMSQGRIVEEEPTDWAFTTSSNDYTKLLLDAVPGKNCLFAARTISVRMSASWR